METYLRSEAVRVANDGQAEDRFPVSDATWTADMHHLPKERRQELNTTIRPIDEPGLH